MDDQRSISPLSSVSSTRVPHSSRPTDKAGAYTSVHQSEDDSGKPAPVTHIISTPSTQRGIFRFGWWWEIYATTLAVASTIAVISVLISIQGKPLADWGLPIQPNSLVAVFSTIAKSALLVPIAECISQLKWTYFEAPRTLSQMQVFDDASRGPWGALVMLWKTSASALLASLGALITILLLAFEPFTQQVVRVEVRTQWITNETSTVSYAMALEDSRLVNTTDLRSVDPEGRLTFTLAMLASLRERGLMDRPPTYQSNNVCGTTRCTYPPHVSLAAQAKCDIAEVRTNNGFGCEYYIRNGVTEINRTLEELGIPVEEQSIRRFTRLPEFKKAVKENDNVSKYGMNCTIKKEDYPSIYITYEYLPDRKVQNLTGEGELHYVPFARPSFIPARATVFGNAEVQQEDYHSFWGTDNLDATNITGSPFAFCTSKRYTFPDGFPTLNNFTLGTFACLDTDSVLPGIANLDTFGEFKANLFHCSVELNSVVYQDIRYGKAPDGLYFGSVRSPLISPSWYVAEDLYMEEEGTTANDFAHIAHGGSNHFVIRPSSMAYLSQMIDETLYSDNARDFALQRRKHYGWPTVINDISVVAGNYIRSTDNPAAKNATGMAWAPQSYIKVEWRWLVLPLALVFLSVVFLVLTAVQSRRKAYLYKNSVLAATMHGLEGWGVDEMRQGGRRTWKDLVEQASGMEARLVSGEDGTLRFVRQR